MNTTLDTLTHLSEHELLEHFENLVARDRRTTARLLVAIAEIDERKVWAAHACPSMFAFCVERFHMSEQVTAKGIWAARTARRFPVILEMVERGELHLTAIQLLSRHLTPENCSDILGRARHKSSREIERLVAALAPRPDVASSVRALPRTVVGAAHVVGADAAASDAAAPSDGATMRSESESATTMTAMASGTASAALRPCPVQLQVGSPAPATPAKPITALSPRRYKIEITVDEDTHDKLCSLQDLLGRSEVGRDPAAIISRAIDVLLADALKRKAAATDRPRPAPQPHDGARGENPERKTRSIPAAVRRVVWLRDCGRCCYEDGRGRRCSATSNVDFHHKDPFARGGCHDADNVELRCAAHNQYQADLDFGRGFMDARRSASAHRAHSARTVASGAPPAPSPRNVGSGAPPAHSPRNVGLMSGDG